MKTLPELQDLYEENFVLLKKYHILRNSVYFNALKKEDELEHIITKKKKKLGLLSKDPCLGQPCHQCIYQLGKTCNVEQNIKDNNGIFSGFTPQETYTIWKQHKLSVMNKYYYLTKKRKKGHE